MNLQNLILKAQLRPWVGLIAVIAVSQASIWLLMAGRTPALPGALGVALLSLCAYGLWVRWGEGRTVTELSSAGALSEALTGVLLALALVACVVAALWATGAYQIVGQQHWRVAEAALATAVVASVVEELLFRGFLMRWLHGLAGPVVSLALTSMLFGAAHLANPGASLLAAAAVAVEAGLLLGTCFLLTRRLWLPIGVHLGWNFGQSGVFGLQTSGAQFPALLSAQVQGPAWWTGGRFGPEASVIAVGLCLACSLWMLRRIARRGRGWALP